MTVATERLLVGAELLAAVLPDAADYLRTLAEQGPDLDRVGQRRQILRKVWKRHFPGLARTPAAIAIATAWAAHAPAAAPPVPGSLASDLDRLHPEGFRPLGCRQICDDLDQSMG